MNNLDKQYQELLKTILEYGIEKKDRTGTGTKSIFGYTIRHNMSEGFPLLTTKRMGIKTLSTELKWFLKGDTNIKFLVDNGCHIWDGDAYKAYVKYWEPNIEYIDGKAILTQEEFINKIETDDEFAEKWGELGPIYGKQWRSWEHYDEIGQHYSSETQKIEQSAILRREPIDQIKNLINELKTNPDSRRLMVSAWNVGELDQMVLPPCHYGFQVYTRELSQEERWKLANLTPNMTEFDYCNKLCDENNVPKRAISLMWNQRSVDTFLGLPFNIASYGLLLILIAREVNMIPENLIGNLGDTHLYLNHLEQAEDQISREPFELPKLELLESNLSEGEFEFNLLGYQSHSQIKAPLSN